MLVCYLRTTTAYPRRSNEDESFKAPDSFCKNFTDTNVKAHCQYLNSNSKKYCSYNLPKVVNELCESLHECKFLNIF